MDVLEQLKTFGYAFQPNVFDEKTCAKMAEELDELEERKRNETYARDGYQVMAYNFHCDKPDTFLHLLDGEPIWSVVKQVLTMDEQIILNNMLASRAPKSIGSIGKVHIDTGMPAQSFENTDTIIAMICVDDFTVDNGATYFWPYSHLSGARPPKDIPPDKLPGSVRAVAKRGTVMYMLGQTWHAIGPNLTGERRWGIINRYTYWWLKPTFDFTHCGPEIYARLTTRQKALLGFNTRPPVSSAIRTVTVTKAEDLPDDYETAMRPDFSLFKKTATNQTVSASKS